jgi:hypothetical protein
VAGEAWGVASVIVTAQQVPGPVYPMLLVAKQPMMWAVSPMRPLLARLPKPRTPVFGQTFPP